MYHLLYAIIWLHSKLPFRVLYALSDVLSFVAYRVVGYRRAVVRENLLRSFPERSEAERLSIEREFYHFLGDYIVETMKACTLSHEEMKRRMVFEGADKLVADMQREGKRFAFIYFAHYGNWEWMASLSDRVHELSPEMATGQVYHPLRNKAFDRIFLRMRARYKGQNVPMKETLRYILQNRAAERPTVLGFIADQAPKWNSIHHFTPFLHRQTAVFTGTEVIGKRVDALIYYAHIERPRRGYYHCTLSRMTDDVCAHPDFEITDQYFQLLEQTIQARPGLWLWSHKRWKRTYEEYLERQKEQKEKHEHAAH